MCLILLCVCVCVYVCVCVCVCVAYFFIDDAEQHEGYHAQIRALQVTHATYVCLILIYRICSVLVLLYVSAYYHAQIPAAASGLQLQPQTFFFIEISV